MVGTMGVVIMKRLSRLWRTRRFVWCRHSLTKRARRPPAAPAPLLCRQASGARCVGRSSNAKTITGDTCASTPACCPSSARCVRAASTRGTTCSTTSSAALYTPAQPAPPALPPLFPPLTPRLLVTTSRRPTPEEGLGMGGGLGGCLRGLMRSTPAMRMVGSRITEVLLLPSVVLIGLAGLVIYRAGVTLRLSWGECVPAGVPGGSAGEAKLAAGSPCRAQDSGVY